MVTLEIDLSDVLDETHDDDAVVVWPPAHREGSRGQVIAPRKRTIPLVGGKATVQVEPGPLDVQIRAQDGRVDGEVRRLTVPEEGSVTLTALFDSAGAFTYAPSIIGQVAQMRDDAEDAAVRAEGVADAFGSLEGVADQVQAAEAAASSAEADRLVVEQAATSASWSGDRLTVLGATSPPLTGEPGPAGAAPYVGANGNWWVGDTDTGVRAQGEKGESGDGAGDVLWSEIDPILDGKAPASHQHSWGDVTGKPSTYPPGSHSHPSTDISDSTSTGRNVLAASSQAAARTAIGAGTSNLALGTTSSTAAPGNHTHTVAQITDLPTITENNVGGAIVRRYSTGQILVPETPNVATAATSKSYVDTEVGKKADSSRVTALEGSQPIIVSSMDPNPLPGRIYYVTG